MVRNMVSSAIEVSFPLIEIRSQVVDRVCALAHPGQPVPRSGLEECAQHAAVPLQA
jgi:hypothetical protein